MQNIPRWKKSDRGSSHFRHGLDPRLQQLEFLYRKIVLFYELTVKWHSQKNFLQGEDKK